MKNNIVVNYIKTAFEELTKVTWPTKAQAVRLTIIVLVFCVVVSFLLGALDFLLNSLYDYVLTLR